MPSPPSRRTPAGCRSTSFLSRRSSSRPNGCRGATSAPMGPRSARGRADRGGGRLPASLRTLMGPAAQTVSERFSDRRSRP
jgi:hypothetical protein